MLSPFFTQDVPSLTCDTRQVMSHGNVRCKMNTFACFGSLQKRGNEHHLDRPGHQKLLEMCYKASLIFSWMCTLLLPTAEHFSGSYHRYEGTVRSPFCGT